MKLVRYSGSFFMKNSHLHVQTALQERVRSKGTLQWVSVGKQCSDDEAMSEQSETEGYTWTWKIICPSLTDLRSTTTFDLLNCLDPSTAWIKASFMVLRWFCCRERTVVSFVWWRAYATGFDHQMLPSFNKLRSGLQRLFYVLRGNQHCAGWLGIERRTSWLDTYHLGVGDETRNWGPPFVGSESCYFLSMNRNKQVCCFVKFCSASVEIAELHLCRFLERTWG